ncbi:MAG: DUF5330 domain-containing protein [Hyphomicrobiales bacterium]|nr:DUF5330 domain-containing protein [Hyphomicrobiales bacterium]
MFFLLRAAFWLSLVVLLIPADPTETSVKADRREVSTFEAIGAAHSTLRDLEGFCERNPTTCDTGRVALDGFGAKARTGARWVYQQLDGRDATPTGSTPATDATAPRVDERPAATRAAIPLPQARPLS